MQQYDGANIGALVPYEVETCVRKKFFQFDWPCLEGSILQNMRKRIVVSAVAAVPDSAQSSLTGMNNRATAIKHNTVLVCP
ncbi:hypothetical protein ACVWXN_007895 [Bradyrhizobium sp. i1.4.4]